MRAPARSSTPGTSRSVRLLLLEGAGRFLEAVGEIRRAAGELADLLLDLLLDLFPVGRGRLHVVEHQAARGREADERDPVPLVDGVDDHLRGVDRRLAL